MTSVSEKGLQRVFFYGLFMDAALLEDMDVHPVVLGPAELEGFRLRIGDKATLVQSDGSRSYGQLMDISLDDVKRLYSGPGLEDYTPEPVDVRLLRDQRICQALSYHLPVEKLGTTTNAAYARQLADVARRTGFPGDYCHDIEQLAAD